MKLNPKKFKEVMNFMKNQNIVMRSSCAGNFQIERVSSYKLLGVFISEELKWNHHIDYLVTKASERLCLTTSEKSVNTSDLLICL